MKPNDLDETLIQLLDSAIHCGDCTILIDSFSRENTYVEKLDSIFLKLGEDLKDFCNDLPSTDVLVSNSLQILTELIQAFGISETLCVYLARTVLLLIIDEKCGIVDIKRAIHFFNLLLQNPSVINAIVTDESLEGSMQIFGRKIPDIGDYECQALLFEALYRITSAENREYWASIWFSDVAAKNMFLNLDPLKFELNCRKALNYINRNESQRRVFSFIAQHVYFGSFLLKGPHDCEFWIDFNYDSQCISFYCSELYAAKLLDDSALWETIVINSSSVKSYFLKDKVAEKSKEVVLLLNCPCHTLVTSSSITNPVFNSYEIKISFWGILNIQQHLEKIFGKDKYADEVPLSQNRKASNVSDVIQVINEFSDTWTNEVISQRKISISAPISVDTFGNDYVTEIEEAQRHISQKSNTVPNSYEKIYEDISACSKRKTSYSIDSKNDEDEYQVTKQRIKRKKRKMMKRKVKVSPTSSLSDNIKTEISNLAKLGKIQANVKKENSFKSNTNKPIKRSSISAQVQISNCDPDVLKNNPNNVIPDEHVHHLNDNHSVNLNNKNKLENICTETCKEEIVVIKNRNSDPMVIEDSLNENYINFEQVTDNKESMSPQEKHKICTILKQDNFETKDNMIEANNNNENQEVLKESGESSRETNNSEAASKSHIKKVRLYNLESAPVYDVPPSSSNKSSTEKQICNIQNSKIDGEHTDISASTVINATLHEKRDSDDLGYSLSSGKRNRNSTEDSTEKTSKGLDDQIKIYDIIPESDDDFVESTSRGISSRKKRCATVSSVLKERFTKKRKYETSHSHSSQTIQNERSVRTPRQAAVKAMKVNKRILDLTSEIACDRIEVLDESDDVSPTPVIHKKKRLSKVFSSGQTDTETGSSEVSWLKRKSCPLFESPKRNYSGWKKTNCKKEVVPNVNSSARKSQKQRKKKTARIRKSVESGSKSKSAGLSDLEKFNLTVEKSRDYSHSIMKALENDLQSISTNARKKKFK